MTDSKIVQFQASAQQALRFLTGEFAKLQTGRANAALIDHIEVDAYDQRMPIRSLATIAVQDARSIVVQPWDRSALAAIEKALQQANLGTNPVNDGTTIRINLPSMTEERRHELVRIVHRLAEDARISVRQHRQTAHDALKMEKEEDVRQTLTDALQKEVDRINTQIDDARRKKEEEILKV